MSKSLGKMQVQAGDFPELWPTAQRAVARRHPQGEALARMSRAMDGEWEDDEALADPTGENAASPAPLVHHKYADRALVILSRRCLVHCRFCFRRTALSGTTTQPGEAERAAAWRWVAATPAIREVIFSGGDPLALADARIARELERFAHPVHVERLRIHTRAPVVEPNRVTDGLLAALARSPKPVRLVLHVNHPGELHEGVRRAVDRLRSAGVALFTQSVLLRGVNDDARVLAALFARCRKSGLGLHYLHHPDRTFGNASFRRSIADGLALYRRVREQTGEDRCPRYVLDLPSGHGKTPVEALWLVEQERRRSSLRRRYLWRRPEGWPGVLAGDSFTWWDIRETEKD